MQQGGVEGFRSAPLSKLAWVLTLALSLAAMLADAGPLVWYTPGAGLWRVAASALVLTRPLELLTALLLLYRFRAFERQLGTAKTCVLAATAFAAHVLACVALLALPSKAEAPLAVYGPFWAIFACAVLYARDVPASVHVRLCGALRASDKWLVYALLAQLLLAGLPGSAVGAAAGVLAGLLFRSDALGLADVRPPQWLRNCCAAVFLPILEGFQQPQQPAVVEVAAAAAGAAGRRLDDGDDGGDVFAASDRPLTPAAVADAFAAAVPTMPTTTPTLPVATPAPAAVEALVAMGFDERAAREALVRCGGTNVEAAAALLLDSH